MALIDGLISHWKLDEASGTSAADSHGSNTGTLAGTEAWVSGKIGNAFDFNEASRFNCGADAGLDLTTDGTIAAWINPDDLGESSLGRIVSKEAAAAGYVFNLASSTGNKLQLSATGGAGSLLSGVISFGVWSHVVATWTGGNASIYINGTLSTTGAWGPVTSAVTAPLRIGGRDAPLAENRDFDGEIDEVSIWNRSLTAPEVTSLYNSGNGLPYPFHDFTSAFNSPIFGGMFSPLMSGI